MRLAVVGATGAVGRQMLRILEQRAFPADEVTLLASARSAGSTLRFRGEDVQVRELAPGALDGIDLALSSCGGATAKTWIPAAAAAGTICVDNSSAFRMDPDAAITIPEVNPESLTSGKRIFCVPNCTIITTLVAVAPLHREAGLRSLIVSSYQSASGAGARGLGELIAQVDALHGREELLLSPGAGDLPPAEVFPKTLAWNVVPQIDVFDPETAYTFEEIKMQREARRILDMPDLDITTTCVRVPTAVGHAVSVHATFDRPITPDEARAILREAPGVEVRDDPANGIYPTPLDAAGRDEVQVGRIRRHEGRDDALLLFASGDNLRKGAALNAVQIAERLVG